MGQASWNKPRFDLNCRIWPSLKAAYWGGTNGHTGSCWGSTTSRSKHITAHRPFFVLAADLKQHCSLKWKREEKKKNCWEKRLDVLDFHEISNSNKTIFLLLTWGIGAKFVLRCIVFEESRFILFSSHRRAEGYLNWRRHQRVGGNCMSGKARRRYRMWTQSSFVE